MNKKKIGHWKTCKMLKLLSMIFMVNSKQLFQLSMISTRNLEQLCQIILSSLKDMMLQVMKILKNLKDYHQNVKNHLVKTLIMMKKKMMKVKNRMFQAILPINLWIMTNIDIIEKWRRRNADLQSFKLITFFQKMASVNRKLE